MDDLIKAFQIFSKYTDAFYPTWCTFDTLNVDVSPIMVSDEDKAKLEELGFSAIGGGFTSFRFGSC